MRCTSSTWCIGLGAWHGVSDGKTGFVPGCNAVPGVNAAASLQWCLHIAAISAAGCAGLEGVLHDRAASCHAFGRLVQAVCSAACRCR
jgi:hypothetical protein